MSQASFKLILTSIFFFFLSTISYSQEGYTLPSNFYEATCVFPSEQFDMSIAEKYRSAETDVSTYFSAVVGDLDGDGFSEIVIPGGTHNKEQYIYIFNHKAELIRKVNLPDGITMNINDDSVVLADLDGDGKSEIIVTASNGRQLLVLNYKGDLIASASYPTAFPKTVGVADFNQDGIPEIYVGTSIYSLQGTELRLIAEGGYRQATVAQDVLQEDGRYIPELVSVEGVYRVTINNTRNVNFNSVNQVVWTKGISTISTLRERTFALADIDLDGIIDVITVVPVRSPRRQLEVKIWSTQTGEIKYSYNIELSETAGSSIRNSWPFIGDTDANGYPDIIFMGGTNSKGHTSIYRLEYDRATNKLVERVRNNTYNDYSSMSTSMSMFDFNNDGKQEIVYRDEDALYIINGETLDFEPENKIANCFSGTGWEYPVVASLTPSGESAIIMTSGDKRGATVGTLRIYGADVSNGNKPWMPARRAWNQYSFYQNMIDDNLKVISKPAPLNVKLTSSDGAKTIQPFNGHMTQLGIIRPSTLQSVYPLADISIDINNATYGHNKVDDILYIDFNVYNTGDAPMDPNIPIEVFKILDVATGKAEHIYSSELTNTFYPGDEHAVSISIPQFSKIGLSEMEAIEVYVGKNKYDCNPLNNSFTIHPLELSGVIYVKKASNGAGLTWGDALGELSEALEITKVNNKRYPHSLTQIWVAEGIYEGNFVMQDGVNIYGGFKGKETKIEDSRPLQHPTILDAKGVGRTLTQSTSHKRITEWRGLTLQNGQSEEHGGGASLQENGILSYSIIRGNSTSLNGGGIYANKASIINCIVEANSSPNMGGGIYAVNNSIAVNNTIVKNTALSGGGVYTIASTIINNIIYRNSTDNISETGGIVKNNLANNDNNIDPQFTNFERGDYSLLPISPAINNGNNEAIANREFDIIGKKRVFDDKIVDIGAYEYQGMQLALSKEGYFYVNHLKNGDGSNWTNAVQQLSDALDAARLINAVTPNKVKRIWVAKGTYKGTFEIVEGTNVHGGFAGYETDFNQIDTIANKTYLDAERRGRVLTQTRDFNTSTEWAGFVLQNGSETAIDQDVYGGGAYLRKNGILRYNTIRNNEAIATSYKNKVNAYGGGVYLEEGAKLSQAIIDNNYAIVKVESELPIGYGVAQGGGVNNIKNRLEYLILRNNRTTSQNNTDGAGAYTSGQIVNSIINHNQGLSAVYVNNTSLVNNTIVDNAVSYVIKGTPESKVMNSILYNARNESEYFKDVEGVNYNNFVSLDPLFEQGSYHLTMNSAARLMGNATHFPQDLNVDMDKKSRFILLQNGQKVIDTGAFQTDIKVVSAKADTITVPFGTKFKDLSLPQPISGLLEKGHVFQSDINWIEGSYDAFTAQNYTLYGDLSNFSEGIVNPDKIQGLINVVVQKNHIAEIEDININNEPWLDQLDQPYILGCDNNLSDQVHINLTLPTFANVELTPQIEYNKTENQVTIVYNITKPGKHSINVKVTSQDGLNTKNYTLLFDKYFAFWNIIEQRWNNTFVINNNSASNGGYDFATYKWYKNNLQIGTNQYYSAGDRRTDLLDESALYHAEMMNKEGNQYRTCAAYPVLMNSSIKVYPNPVKANAPITIETPTEEGQEVYVNIYSLSGLPIKQTTFTSNKSTIEAPNTTGMYILHVTLAGGVTESLRMIVY